MATNVEKEKIILKIFLSKKDIQVLMDGANWKYVEDIYFQARADAVAEGKAHFSTKVHYKRVLDRLHLEEAEIHRMANLERKLSKGEKVTC